jgi:hypothetical protein
LPPKANALATVYNRPIRNIAIFAQLVLQLDASYSANRAGHTATLLNSGDVLVTGGYAYAGIGMYSGDLASAELYRPATPSFARTVLDRRKRHGAGRRLTRRHPTTSLAPIPGNGWRRFVDVCEQPRPGGSIRPPGCGWRTNWQTFCFSAMRLAIQPISVVALFALAATNEDGGRRDENRRNCSIFLSLNS